MWHDSGSVHDISSGGVICLSETMHKSASTFSTLSHAYKAFHAPAQVQRKGHGMCTLVARSMFPTAHLFPMHIPEGHHVIAVDLGTSTHIHQRMVVVSTYIPPQGSVQHHSISLEDRFHFLLAMCQSILSTGGSLVLGGDFNAHLHGCGHMQDDLAGTMLRDLADITGMTLLTGSSFEVGHNLHSYRTLTTDGLRIRGSSRPDHILCSPSLLQSVKSSCVRQDIHLCDHHPIELVLMHVTPHNSSFNNTFAVTPACKLPWKDREVNYVQCLDNLISQGQFDKVIDLLQEGNINEFLDGFITNIVLAAGQAGAKMKVVNQGESYSKGSAGHPWFDNECWLARKQLRYMRRKHAQQFRLHRNRYKALLKAKRVKWRNDSIDSLIHELHRDPKRFWDRMRNKSSVSSADVDVADCVGYFRQLFAHNTNHTHNYTFNTSTADSAGQPFNANFTEDEILCALQRMQNGKASGADGIPGEYYKYAVHRDQSGKITTNILVAYLKVVFQWMFDHSCIPSKWGEGLITLVLKGKGSTSDWNSYRPIAVIHTLCKVYGLVLHARLNDWAERQHIRRPSQAGFRPQYNTNFNCFTLQHIIQKYKQKQQAVFCCFVDFTKAYDKVVRSLVWKRLFDIGFRGKMLLAIMSFYNNVTSRIKFADGITEAFPCGIGVRQGCPLSPFLFGVFIEILHDWVVERQPQIGARLDYIDPALIIPLLMYADDLVKIAECADHLQILLDILAEFCEHHDVDVNLVKTRIVVFNKMHASAADKQVVFVYRNQEVPFADGYKYLGLFFPATYNVKQLIRHAAARGRKAIGCLYYRFNALGINSNIFLKHRLFDAIALPNIAFGCEVWGPWFLQPNLRDHSFDNPVEKVRLNFYKLLLQLRSSTTNWCIYRELGVYPLQLYIARQCIRFCNKLLVDFGPDTWARCALLDAWHMYCQPGGKHSNTWFAKLIGFLDSVGVSACGHEDGVQVYLEEQVMTVLRHTCHSVFVGNNLPSKIRSYNSICALELPGNGDTEWELAPYIRLPLPAHKLSLLARFRLRCHNLAVEVDGWIHTPSEQRVCGWCGSGVVEDEHHHLFDCSYYEQYREELPLRLLACTSIHDVFSTWNKCHGMKGWPKLIKALVTFLTNTGRMFQMANS